jgi:AraC family transcriptional regulator
VAEGTRDQPELTNAAPDTAHGREQNPIWSFPGFPIEKTRSWGLISADIVSREAGAAVWRSKHHRIVYALTDILGTIQSDGHPADKDGLYREKIAFRPGGVAVRSYVPTAVRFIQILQNPDTYHSLTSEMVRGGVVHLEPRVQFEDPLVSRIVLTIASEMEGGFLDRILADALNTAMAVQLIRQFVDPSAITLAPSNGLARERVKRVCDYIEEHLDDRLTLTEIAGVACLSPYHFSRSFKKAIGVGLRRYVMQRRIERAKTLLRRTAQPLSWVAHEAGFYDQSHFTAEFRREIGVTPGRFRAAQT